MDKGLDKTKIFETKRYEYRKQFRYADVIKAYDNVNQDLIKDFAKSLNEDWKNLIEDYNNTNMKLGNKIIKRTIGLPQGGKYSPILFNFYLDKALSNVDISQDYIYADNLALFGTKIEELDKKEEEYVKALNNAGLKVDEWDVWNYTHSKLYASNTEMENIKNKITKTCPPSNIPKANHETKRILGFNLSIKGDKININKKDINTKYEVKKYPPYKAINNYKQRIEPKFQHQTKHINNFNIDRVRHVYLKKTLATTTIPRKYFEANFHGEKTYWHKFLSLYYNEITLLDNEEIKIPSKHDILQFNRWLKLCRIMKNYYIPYYQMIRFIYLGRCRLILADKLTYNSIKHNAKLLDYGWYIITSNWSIHTAMMMIQLKILIKLGPKIMKKKFKIQYNIPEHLY